MRAKNKQKCLQGIPICRGIAVGKPFFFHFIEDDIPEFAIAASEVPSEIQRYRDAIARSYEDVERLKIQLQMERITEGAAILEAHQQMILDPQLTSEVEELLRQTRKNAEYVFHQVIKGYQKKFGSLDDPFFRERFKDMQDISRRVMGYLRESVHFTLADIPEGSIIFADEFTPSDIAAASKSSAIALVAANGGANSHAAIVAKAKGIPYVSSVDFSGIDLEKFAYAIVDGRTGDIFFNPSQEILSAYEKLSTKLQSHVHQLSATGCLIAETYDGYRIRLSANIDMAHETESLHQHGGSGVGLFRSEYMLMTRDSFPSEDEQFHIYKQIVKEMRGLPIVIRTFDIGGDKTMGQAKQKTESNPYLGCRAIRLLLKESEIFKAQLRAILRASTLGEVSVMFPMVSTLSELLEAKKLLQEAKEELAHRGIALKQKMRVGCMIEVPSAALISDFLSRECDFLSIGTNDLVQYSLAVDRNNHDTSNLYTPAHPSVLRLIKLIVTEANHHSIPVSVCGEVAADPRFTPLLLGLGVHELSVASRFIPIIKNAIRNTSIVAACHLAEQVMHLSTAAEIEALLTQEYKRNVPEDCFYNC